jgi:hypothetical protein
MASAVVVHRAPRTLSPTVLLQNMLRARCPLERSAAGVYAARDARLARCADGRAGRRAGCSGRQCALLWAPLAVDGGSAGGVRLCRRRIVTFFLPILAPRTPPPSPSPPPPHASVTPACLPAAGAAPPPPPPQRSRRTGTPPCPSCCLRKGRPGAGLDRRAQQRVAGAGAMRGAPRQVQLRATSLAAPAAAGARSPNCRTSRRCR